MTQKYNEIYQESIKNREDFWKAISNDIFWYKKPTKILNSQNPPFYKWFEDGMLNASYNCIDRHVRSGDGDKVALVFESDDGKIENVSYKKGLGALDLNNNAGNIDFDEKLIDAALSKHIGMNALNFTSEELKNSILVALAHRSMRIIGTFICYFEDGHLLKRKKDIDKFLNRIVYSLDELNYYLQSKLIKRLL